LAELLLKNLEPLFTAPAPLVLNANGTSPIVLVCEHASHFIPPELDGLGLSNEAMDGHWAWDPGAMAVAEAMSARLDAPLVASQVSRLVYDCNRPPNASGAMVTRGEGFEIPGNAALNHDQRQARIDLVYEPFRAALAGVVATKAGAPVLVTIHSFTPVYYGKIRKVQLGILHDDDARFADAILQEAHCFTSLDVERNQPYAASDGVTHTLREHAINAGLLNVMLEIRNDLIATEGTQQAIAAMVSDLVLSALSSLGVDDARDKS